MEEITQEQKEHSAQEQEGGATAKGLERKFVRYAEAQQARVLTQMDRDPNSPTFGCFDRNYWHYKIRDFPSTVLQQGVFLLESMRRGDLPCPVPTEQTERWSVGAINALARQVRPNGSVDEYYPYEQSYPAAAFGLQAVCHTLVGWQESAPHLLRKIDWAPLRRLARHIAARQEKHAANQQAAGLAGLALADRLPALALSSELVEEHFVHLLAMQSEEGWFGEYGGPDFGYLTVTLDALTDYHDATGDERALQAMERAVDFLARMVGVDGRLPSTLNSRNTDYVVPYGLVRLAARNATAAWLVETLFRDVEEPSHFLWATDDRYHTHYLFGSVVRCLPHLRRMMPGQASAHRASTWMPECGFWIYRAPDQEWNAFAAARKGGVLRIHRRAAPPIVDHGWRIHFSAESWTSNWWSPEWHAAKEESSLRISGPCQPVRYHVPSPPKHLSLRMLSRVVGKALIPWLKRFLIFQPSRASRVAFRRRIEIGEGGVYVTDRIAGPSGAVLSRSPRQNTRHVASADVFSPDEGAPLLSEAARHPSPDGSTTVHLHWAADEPATS